MKRRSLLSALAATPALAQLPRPPAAPAGALLFTGARVHPVCGPVLEGGQVLVVGERIAAVAAASERLALPPDTQRIALDGLSLYPGLVAANTQLGLVEHSTLRATIDAEETGLLNPNVRAVSSFHADSELVAVARSGGVLTAEVAPLAARGALLAGRSAVLQLDGWHWTDMALRSEHALHLHLPPSRNIGFFGDAQAGGPPAAALQERLRLLDEALGQARAYAAARAADPARPRDLRLEALAPYAAGQAPVVAHTSEPGQLRMALALQQRHGLRLSVLGRGALAAQAEALKARGIEVVVNGVQELPSSRDAAIDEAETLPARLHAAGLRFAIAREGGLSNATNVRNLAHEAGVAVAHGLPADVALRAITLEPARLLGVDDRLGSLEAGKLATLFVADGDVMQAATRVLRAWVRGREISLASRQTRLVDKYGSR